MGKIEIIIADNQALTREGLKSIFESIQCYKITSFVSTKNELFGHLKQNPPSVLIIDPDHLVNFTLSHFQDINSFYSISNILVLTSNNNKENTLNILASGITHFLIKTCTIDDLFNSLDAITKNEDFLCKHAIEVLLNKNTIDQNKEKEVHLTKKEIEIIRLVAQGLTTKDISAKLFLSVHTINTHRRNILKKLNFNNTSELVLYAVRRGITDVLEYYI